MKDEMANVDWTEMEGMKAAEAWTMFKGKVEQVIEKNVPLKPRGSSGRPPWMSRQILREVRKKRRVWSKTKDKNSPEYKNIEKKVRNLIRNAKRNMERKLALENGGNSKPFYSYLKSKLKNKCPVGPLKTCDSSVVRDSAGMAKILNGFFSSVLQRRGTSQCPRLSIARQRRTSRTSGQR
jgi:hypothetical protein